jgi:hypothetical protein
MTENLNETELVDMITNINDCIEEIVKVPEWNNAEILVRGMSATERDLFLRRAQYVRERVAKDRNAPDTTYAELIVLVARHPVSKKLLFNEAHKGMLMTKSSIALERIAQVALRLSGMTPQFIEELQKNSGTGNAGSTTLSPENSATQT